MTEEIKPFYLLRKEDVSGISGTGIVAFGAVLPSGKVVMEWATYHRTLTIFENIEDVIKFHGHDSRTEVIFGQPEKPKKMKKKKNNLE